MPPPNTKTPAMVLQEFSVKYNYSPPEYVLVRSKTGTHENEFHYRVNVAGISALGFGRSKQVAKHDAATKALEVLANEGLYDPNTNPAQEFNPQAHRNESDSPLQPQVNYIGNLKDICGENKIPPPIFTEISDVGPAHCRSFTYECRVASIKTQSTANTKKQAKQLAARDMLDRIRNICPDLYEQFAMDNNALMEHDEEAISMFHDLSPNLNVIPDKSALVEDFPLTLKRIMVDKAVKKEDFVEQFRLRNVEGLDYIFNVLDITYKIEEFQDDPPIFYALFGVDTPFSIMDIGSTKENARLNLIGQIYSILDVLMSIPD